MNERSSALGAGAQVTPTVQLVRPLGAGGMGAVWLAEHTGLKTQVVVKFMLGDLGSSAAARVRFTREAEAAARVKSPHVVQMLDHGLTEDGTPFIVMEHLAGKDLGRWLEEQGKLEPATVVTIVSQVAKALAKVHNAGLLHRDIKPDNIFLVEGEDDVFVKLLDFGIAKSNAQDTESSTLDGQTKTGQVVGTPFYMSPEQVTAQKDIDLRSDLWALGVVTYEALTGQKPFDGPSFGALAVRIATGDPPRPTAANPTLPPTVDAWFARACSRDPAARFASAKELADGLRGAFEGHVSLPPSAVLSDSGPRDGDRVTSRSGDRAVPDLGARPSFVLGATALHPSTPPGSTTPNPALARSEPGAVAIHDEAAPARRKRPPPVAIVGTILLLVAATFVGIKIGRRESSDSIGASPTGAPAPPVPRPAAASTSAATATATPTGEAPTAAPALSTSASASSHTAPAVTTRPAHPFVSPPAKPSATATATTPASASASATPRPGGDPLF